MSQDGDILMLLTSGSTQSFDDGLGMIYTRYGRSIKSFLMSMGASRDEADDLLQEVLISVIERFSQDSSIEISNFKYYLIGIARNKWLNLIRDKRRLPFDELGDLSMIESVEVQDVDLERLSLIVEVLDSLAGPCKELLKSFYFDKKNNLEIAESMGYSNPDTVKSKKYKCLQRLKNLVRERMNAKG